MRCYDCAGVEDVGFEMPDTRASYLVYDDDEEEEYQFTCTVQIERRWRRCDFCGSQGVPDFGYVAVMPLAEGGTRFVSPRFEEEGQAGAFIEAYCAAVGLKAVYDYDRAAERLAAEQGRPY